MLSNDKDTKLFEVDLDLIDESDAFLNETFEGELKRDLEIEGLLSIPIVRRNPSDSKRFQIVDGHSRIRQVRELGARKVLCQVYERLSDVDSLFVSMKMNLKRKISNPMWLACKVKLLNETYKMRLKDIASRLGFSKSYITKCNAFNTLPIEVQDALAHGQITVDEAYALVVSSRRIPDVDISAHSRVCDVCGRVLDFRNIQDRKLCPYCVADLQGKHEARVDEVEKLLECAICKTVRKVSKVALCAKHFRAFKGFLTKHPIQERLS